MSNPKFSFGDRVRHARRPEWGIGAIVKTEELTVNGQRTQRVSVRFPNAGLKTISTAHADLQLVTDSPAPDAGAAESHPIAAWGKMTDSEWLGEVAQRKVEEAMTSLPADVRDPFNSLRKRLAAVLDLYRFDGTGRSLTDWAVAQSGLPDPLSRFTRHELEQFFEQWAAQRDVLLGRLLGEAAGEPGIVRELAASAPAAAGQAVRRLTAER
jgi:hypothetical protein